MAGASHLGRDLAAEALAFIATLDADRRHSAVLPYNAPERVAWNYFAGSRPGLALADMESGQCRAAMTLVRTLLSRAGFASAEGIMALDPQPDHTLAVFGAIENPGPWAWRIDGHHLSISATIAEDGRVAVAPAFMGATPAALDRRHRVHTVLGEEERWGRGVMRWLDTQQQVSAILSATVPDDILTGPGREESLHRPAGLPLSAMTAPQRRRVLELVALYAHRMHGDLAATEMARLEEAGVGRVHFAWMGGLEPGMPHYYRIHGPTLLIEYDNSRDGANHIHTVWHDRQGDFAGDLLGRHLRLAH